MDGWTFQVGLISQLVVVLLFLIFFGGSKNDPGQKTADFTRFWENFKKKKDE